MTPEAARFLEKAWALMDEGDAILAINLANAAGRSAYLAAFHAAQAFIIEMTGRTVKTHKGVQIEFQRLTKDDLDLLWSFDPSYRKLTI